ncbi:MAG: transposase [Bacteroidaceae bacterium]|jgi:transposase-like protein|nr:transposase [Bacteroidaceae bacterium]
MSRQKFSRALKRQIAIEYMQSGKSRQEIALKYGLPNVNTLSSWVNTHLTPFEIKDKCVSLPSTDQLFDEDMTKKPAVELSDQSELIAKLQKQIKQLESDLKRAKDKNIALNVLIDVAEEHGLRIRKKSGAKQ